MVSNIPSTILKFCSLGIVLTAGALWAGSEIENRPKHRDEQTLIGGTIWSQVVIPIGIIISSTADEELYKFIHAYFLLTGFLLLGFTGIMLVISEAKKLKKQESSSVQSVRRLPLRPFDKIYFIIGVLTTVAALVTLIIITGLLAFGAYWTTKYLMNLSAAQHTPTDLLANSTTTLLPPKI